MGGIFWVQKGGNSKQVSNIICGAWVYYIGAEQSNHFSNGS